MDFHPNCCRRVLQELQPMYYPIGNTKSTSVFHAIPGDIFEVLFLGCGDVRNVLATAAEAASYQTLKHLTVHINDNTRQIIARAALLLLLAQDVDPGCKEDMQFLWAVWYCLDLSPAQNTRLKQYLERLLAKDYGQRLNVSFGSGEAAVRGVYRGWIRLAAGAARSPEAVRRERQNWIIRHVGSKPNSTIRDIRGAAECLATSELSHIKPFMTSDRLTAEAYGRELQAWHTSGSAHLGETGGTQKGWVTNPTLLHPDTGAWEVHYAAGPYPSFIPFEQGESISSDRRDPHQLARVCMRKFTELIAGFQACTKPVQVSVRLWLMDAIVCCDSGLPQGLEFDAVDTSNLADNVELLNLLLMAGLRLKKSPYSRLYAHTMIWRGSLRSYLDSSLGVPPEMMPAIFGLRLLTDLTLGHAPFQLHAPLEWAPALESTTALHLSPEGDSCGVRDALKALASRCCRPNTSDRNLSVSNVLIALTPLSLALAIVSAATRIAGIIDVTADWRRNADALFRMLSIPKCMRMEWDAWMCWLLHGRVAPAPKQAPKQGPDVHVYSCRMQMLAMYTGALGAPMLRVVLMDGNDVMQAIMSGGATIDKTFLGDHNQQLNSVCFDTTTTEVAFLLQGRGPRTNKTFILVNMAQQLPLSAVVEVDALTPRPFRGVPPLCARMPLAVPTPLWATPPHLALRSVVEHANHYLATVGFDSEAAGDGLTVSAIKDDYNEAPCAHGISISLPSCNNGPSLRFACPVNLENYKLQRSRKRGLLICTLPKGGLLWPGDAAFLPKLAPHGLPEAPSQEVLACAMGFMFDDVESASKKLNSGFGEHTPFEKTCPKDPIEASLFEVRDTIQILFVMAYRKQAQHHILEAPGSDERDKMQIIVHKKVRMLPDGRPLLQISYVDELETLKKKPDMPTLHRALDRFKRASARFVAQGLPGNTVKCAPGEIAYFRNVLRQNSARTIPSKAQSEILELPNSEWRASFLVPLYIQRHDTKGGDVIEVDQLKPLQGAPPDCDLAELIKRCGLDSMLDPTSGSIPNGSSATGAPKENKQPEAKKPEPKKPEAKKPEAKKAEAKKTEPKNDKYKYRESFTRNCSLQWKQDLITQGPLPDLSLQLVEEAKRIANDCFKAGNYSMAGGNYRFAMYVLEQLGKPEDPAHRELFKSLHLNMAAVNLKYVERDHGPVIEPTVLTRGGLDDTGILEEVVVHCNEALSVDPTNAKALYRQAQVMVRLGLDAIAEERLEKAMHYEKGDSAMHALLKGIRKRLSASK